MSDEAERHASGFRVEGRVQGVGFRYFVENCARDLGLAGWVKNLPDGAVELVAEGKAGSLTDLEEKLTIGPPSARVTGVTRTHASGTWDRDSFKIVY